MKSVTFFYDLGSPYAYLAADRVDELFDVDVDVEWVPVLLGAIHKHAVRESWAIGPGREAGIAEIARRAAAYGLPTPQYPEGWPGDGLAAMRVATWAHSAGMGRAFARAAFEVHFVDGLALSEPENIELAAHRAGLDPQFALGSAGDSNVKQELRENTEAAIAAGVIGVPSLIVGDTVYWGEDKLEQAAAAADEL